jgi:NADH-quinone oxidoreductase subunit L
MVHLVYLIPLFPLAGYLVLAPFGRRIGNPLAGWLATALVFASFVVTILVFAGLFELAPPARIVDLQYFTWFNVDHLNVQVGLLVDPLSMTMISFITGVSMLIHLYSIGYMEHDEDFPKFFAYLNLFVFAMLVLVLADNFLLSFFGWEGVGVCSYFLISFWYTRPSAASAGKKAMIYNRIGDAGFLLAMFLIFERTGSLNYLTVFSRLSQVPTSSLVAIALLAFLGAAGKSAQIPLFPWLADAMEGPTPVSALIHAATMVTAGVYLMCRINPILHLAPDAAHVIAWVGVSTAFVAATIGCAQTDIKKVLAYSTVSQLGYMFLAAGCGAYDAAIFLMLTHAFYKALLFLGSGSVIHAMGDEQDIKRMGALQKLMPLTALTFLIGWLSIAGVPPFSGFWAKSEVLINAWGVTPGLWVIGAITAVLTAYYMGREYFLVFLGPNRWANQPAPANPEGEGDHGHALHPHDARWVMSLPLVILSVLSILGGFIDLPFHPDFNLLERWLDPVVGKTLFSHHESLATLWAFGVIDGALALTGVALAVMIWRSAVDRPSLEPRFLYMAWFIDASYDRLIARPTEALSSFTAAVLENKVIDGVVNGLAAGVRSSGQVLRKVQNGYVRNYALGLIGGLVVLGAYMLVRAG